MSCLGGEKSRSIEIPPLVRRHLRKSDACGISKHPEWLTALWGCTYEPCIDDSRLARMTTQIFVLGAQQLQERIVCTNQQNRELAQIRPNLLTTGALTKPPRTYWSLARSCCRNKDGALANVGGNLIGVSWIHLTKSLSLTGQFIGTWDGNAVN